MKDRYVEPILRPLSDMNDPIRFQGGGLGFEELRIHRRGKKAELIHAFDLDEAELAPFINIPVGIDPKNPCQVMGIVNVTPDSFSDGGKFADGQAAINHAEKLIADGADILDIGAESTRPNADFVSEDEELARLTPLFDVLKSLDRPVSVDTRKAIPANAAIEAGAWMINDVSALSFDEEMVEIVAKSNAMLCLMHAQGDPKTMQDDPNYDNVLLDIYDYLEERVNFAAAKGIDPSRIVIDPGIGFGKNLQHNLSILNHIAIFHGLGVPVLVGASRKRMIDMISPSDIEQRLAGSLAIALDLARKGVQIIRVHDVFETVQAIRTQKAMLEA